MKPQKFEYHFELENNFETLACVATFVVHPGEKATRDHPGCAPEVEWLQVVTQNDGPNNPWAPNDFESYARTVLSNPEWSLRDLDSEALEQAADHEEGRREEALERKAEARREQLQLDALEATTRGDN